MCILPCLLVDQQIDHSRWFFDEDGGLQKSTIFDIRGEDLATKPACFRKSYVFPWHVVRTSSKRTPMGCSRFVSNVDPWIWWFKNQWIESPNSNMNPGFLSPLDPPNFMGHQFGDSKTQWKSSKNILRRHWPWWTQRRQRKGREVDGCRAVEIRLRCEGIPLLAGFWQICVLYMTM